MHFAAHTIVPESVALPLKYYGNNTCATRSLLQACIDHGVQHFVFSSTAAVYGIPEGGYAGEDIADAPINAYGTSKLMSEWMLRDVAAVNPLRYVALRYFNVAGSDPAGRIGQATPGATLLTKVACEAMVGKRPHVSIFGTDYPTPDGTGVRDYLHVEDLAAAHLRALDYLRARRPLGYAQLWVRPRLLGARGAGMVESVGGRPLVHPRGGAPRRRSGLSCGAGRAHPQRARLAAARYDDLRAIVSQLRSAVGAQAFAARSRAPRELYLSAAEPATL